MRIGGKMAKDIKQAKASGCFPWPIEQEFKHYVLCEDKYAVTQGHTLFMPKINNTEYLVITFQAALQYGNWLVLNGTCDAFNIGMNCGEAAGQTVMYPHIHVIPRRFGDCEDPIGGVHGVIAGKANYKKSSYK